MKKDLLNLYTINMKYNRDLHNEDDRVMSVSPQIGKDTRKFVGIIVIVESKKYCIPLNSFKEKFNKKAREDFIKIPHPTEKDENGGPKFIAVLNLNNMIPVSDSLIKKVDLSKKTPDQNLLINELKWCREHSSEIINKANKLYNKITLTPQKDKNLTKRCCDFKRLEEKVLKKWLSKTDQIVTPIKPKRSFRQNLDNFAQRVNTENAAKSQSKPNHTHTTDQKR